MKRSTFLLPLFISLSLTLATHDAEARRFGGGMSSGMKRGSSITQRSATPVPAPTPNAPAQNLNQASRAAPAAAPAAQSSGMRRWLGPLAGLAAGIGLASLFSHLGMGGGVGSLVMMLLAGVAIFFVIRLLMRRNAPQPQPQMAGAGAGGAYNADAAPQRFEPVTPLAGSSAAAPSSVATEVAHIPAGFDSEGFLRQAKLNFIRLQAANDAGNMDDIRAFTAPEMFAEIQMQYQERGKAKQETDVVQINAALLDVSDEATQQIASVRFSGLIRESADATPGNFDEVWHLARPNDGSKGWVIVGIEQTN